MGSKSVAALLALLFSGCAADAAARPYKFGVAVDPIASSEAASLKRSAFEHFVTALSRRLGEPVTLEVLTTVGEEARALELGRIDMALIKAVPYGRAKGADSRVSGLATVVSRNDNEEVTTHSGYIIALRTNRIDRLSDLKGKRFGFVRDSASGLAYPIAYLSRQRIDYRSDFSGFRCYQSNRDLIEALNAGEIDAGTTYRSPLLERNSDLKHVKIIARIPNIPNPLIAVAASLPQAEKQKLTAALISLPENAFQSIGFFGLRPFDEKLYEPVVALGKADVCA